MRGKGHQGRSFLILLFVIIFAFWWGISVLGQNNKTTASEALLPASASAYAFQNVSGPVEVQAIQKGTVHTYSGSLPVSSSCDELGTGIAVNGTNPAHVTVLLTLTKPLTACAEASGGVTAEPFSVSLSVAPGAKAVLDGLTVNGVIVATNVQAAKTK